MNNLNKFLKTLVFQFNNLISYYNKRIQNFKKSFFVCKSIYLAVFLVKFFDFTYLSCWQIFYKKQRIYGDDVMFAIKVLKVGYLIVFLCYKTVIMAWRSPRGVSSDKFLKYKNLLNDLRREHDPFKYYCNLIFIKPILVIGYVIFKQLLYFETILRKLRLTAITLLHYYLNEIGLWLYRITLGLINQIFGVYLILKYFNQTWKNLPKKNDICQLSFLVSSV